MTDPIERHLQSLRNQRYSTATLTARANVLLTLPDIEDCDRAAVKGWFEERQTKVDGTERAASSLSSEVSHAREFWRWCMAEGHLERNPADFLPKIRQSKPEARPVTEGDLHAAMEAAPEGMRRMLALASMAGLRSAEIAGVLWSDIDRANGVLRVRGGKGAKDRSVPLSAGLLAELGDPDPAGGPIIGRTSNAKAVSAAIGRYMRAQDLDYSAHKLRARYATRFLAATGDAVAAAKVLGHADLSTILRYAVASSDTMRRGAEAAGRIG